ncbi:MAG: SurA N-terminal domain-containing protein [Hyphomicrobiaceae bacterium]
MLDALRRGAGNWLAKILLTLLIFAFAIWGVADVFRGYGQGSLATVGKTEITAEEFQQAYQNELDGISRQAGRRLTPEQARMFGLEQRVLSRLTGTAALDQQARALGLSVSTASITDDIRSQPTFAGMDGKFSKVAFDSYLRQLGFSERRYFDVRKQEEVRELVTEAVSSANQPAKMMIDLVHKFREEKRVIEFVTIDPAKTVKVADPDDVKLKEYFEANKRQFVAPESRKIALLLLTRDAIKANIAVTDDEIKSAYDAEKERYSTPETRRVLQVAFKDKAAADAALAELQKAPDFTAAAVKLGYQQTDVDLGTLTKKAMIDPKIAEATFALKKDEVSKSVEGQFSTVILKVTDVTPGKIRTLSDVQAEVKNSLAEGKANRELIALHDKVEDERSAGKSLKDAAAKHGVSFREIPAIDRAGVGSDGKPALEHPEAQRIVTAAFGGVTGTEADAVDLADGGYAWVDVLGVTPEKERSLDEVKDKVKTAWRDTESRKELASVAAKFVERALKGENFEAIAKDAGGKVEKTSAITRQASAPGLAANAIQQAFALPKAGASSAANTDGNTRTVFRVVDIAAATEPTKEQLDALRQEFGRQMQADDLNAYVGGLQARYGVSFNEAAIRQALGQDRQAR